MPILEDFRYSALQRIGGHLNNCALNIILPYILNGIKDLAVMEEKGEIEELQDNQIYQSYSDLRFYFQEYYQLTTFLENEFIEPFKSWREFDYFLESLAPQNFFAKEIILAPVLRLFIVQQKNVCRRILEENLNSLENLSLQELQNQYSISDLELHKTEQTLSYSTVSEVDARIKRHGRYAMLDILAAARLFHFPFGIYELEITCPSYTEIPPSAPVYIRSPYPFGEEKRPKLKITLRNSHFDINIADSRGVQLPEESLSEELSSIVNQITNNKCKIQSSNALSRMIDFVQREFIQFKSALQITDDSTQETKAEITLQETKAEVTLREDKNYGRGSVKSKRKDNKKHKRKKPVKNAVDASAQQKLVMPLTESSIVIGKKQSSKGEIITKPPKKQTEIQTTVNSIEGAGVLPNSRGKRKCNQMVDKIQTDATLQKIHNHAENNYFKFNCMSIMAGLSGVMLLLAAIVFFPPVGLIAAIGIGASYAYGVSVSSAVLSAGAFSYAGGFFKNQNNTEDDFKEPLISAKLS